MATYYTYNKYNVVTDVSYTRKYTSYSASGTTNYVQSTVYSSYTFDSTTGKFTAGTKRTSYTGLDGKWIYEVYSSSVMRYTVITVNNSTDMDVSNAWTEIVPVKETTYSQGTSVGTVIAEDGTYPDNGKSGSYWYVKGAVYNYAPSTPSSISVSGTFKPGGSITVSWGTSTDKEGSSIKYFVSSNIGSSYAGLATSATFNIPTSVTASSVVFSVYASDGSLSSGTVSSSAYTITYNSAPTTPSSISASGSFKPGGTVNVSWGSSTDADGNAITYYVSSSAGVNIYVGSGTSTSYTIPSSFTEPTMTFFVYAYDGSAQSSARTSSSYTMDYNTAPTNPGSLTATGIFRVGNTLTVSWSSGYDADGDTLSYRVYASTDGGTAYSSIYSGTGRSTSYTIPSMTASIIKFRVDVSDGKIASAGYTYSPNYTMYYNSAPTSPSNVNVDSESVKPYGSFNVNWGASTDADGNQITYQVQYTTDDGVTWSTLSTGLGSVSSTGEYYLAVTLPNLTASRVKFRVRATDGTDYSGYTESSYYTVIYNQAPTKISNVYLNGVTGTNIKMGTSYTLYVAPTTDPEGSEVTYHVQMSRDQGVTWTDIISSSTAPSYTFNATGESYVTFRARATDGSVYNAYTESPKYYLNYVPTLTYLTNSTIDYNEGDLITINGKVTDQDPSQTVTTYAEVTVNGVTEKLILNSSITGSEITYSKSLKFLDNNLYFDGSSTPLFEEVSANGISGTVSTKVYAEDSLGFASNAITKVFKVKPNQAPIISLSNNSISLGEYDSQDIKVTSNDADVDKLTLKYGLRGINSPKTYEMGVSEVTLPLEKTFQVNSYYSDIFMDKERTIKLNPSKLASGVYYLDFYVVDEHGASSPTSTVTINYTANRKPTLSVNTPPLVINEEEGKFIFSGKASDLDSKDNITLTVRVDGGASKVIKVGELGAFSYEYAYVKGDYETHEFVFTVTDGKESASLVRTFTFGASHLIFKLKNPTETDDYMRKASVLLNYSSGRDSNFKMEVCNNGFDVNPTWEDVTAQYLETSTITLKNTTKTADKWGINILITIRKGEAETVYVDRFGIIFE